MISVARFSRRLSKQSRRIFGKIGQHFGEVIKVPIPSARLLITTFPKPKWARDGGDQPRSVTAQLALPAQTSKPTLHCSFIRRRNLDACGWSSCLSAMPRTRKIRKRVEPPPDDEKRSRMLNSLLIRLRERFGRQPRPVKIKPEEIVVLNEAVRPVFLSQPMLIEIDAPIKVVGDVHGQFYDTLRIFDFCGDPTATRYLFLGDYVDRGQLGLETVCLLLALKVECPNSFWLLLGNHEAGRVYGFYDEMRRRFSVRRGESLWREFCRTFNCMPISALIDGRILCMHGGLSPDLENLDMIRQVPRPTDIADYGMVCDIVWADPDYNDEGWSESTRGVSFAFGAEVARSFCKRLGIELIVRAHQVIPEGYKFYAGGRILSIFSAPNYCVEINNSAAVLKIDHDLPCSLEIMRPSQELPLVYLPERKKKKRKR